MMHWHVTNMANSQHSVVAQLPQKLVQWMILALQNVTFVIKHKALTTDVKHALKI